MIYTALYQCWPTISIPLKLNMLSMAAMSYICKCPSLQPVCKISSPSLSSGNTGQYKSTLWLHWWLRQPICTNLNPCRINIIARSVFVRFSSILLLTHSWENKIRYQLYLINTKCWVVAWHYKLSSTRAGKLYLIPMIWEAEYGSGCTSISGDCSSSALAATHQTLSLSLVS